MDASVERKGYARLVVVLVLAVVVVALVRLFPVRELLSTFLAWVQGIGPIGPVLVALAYVPASILFVPGSILTLGAGFAFGVVQGTIAVSIGATAGAAAAFLVGRTLARSWVQGRVAGNARFEAIDRAVGREGFRIVLLTRLSPVFPFNLLNYAFGITDVSFRDYVLASWLGMLPGTVMYVYLGSAAQSLAQVAAGEVEGGAGQKLFFIAGLVATVIVTIFVTRIARRALERETGVGTEAAE